MRNLCLLKLDIIFVSLFMIQIEIQIQDLHRSKLVKVVNIPISLGIGPVNSFESAEFSYYVQYSTKIDEERRYIK